MIPIGINRRRRPASLSTDFISWLWRGGRITAALGLLIVGCSSGEVDEVDPPGVRGTAPLEAVDYGAIGDGKIVFERIRNGNQSVYVIDADGLESWGFQPEPGLLFDGPCVSPDGMLIAYGDYAGVESLYDIFVADLNGENRRRRFGTPDHDKAPSWTADGRHLVYSSIAGLFVDEELAYSNTSGAGVFPSFETRHSVNDDLDLLIAAQAGIYRLDSGEESPTLWIPRPDSIPQVRMVAAWSPDAQRIAYLMWSRDLQAVSMIDIWVINEDRTDPVHVASMNARDLNEGSWAGSNEVSIAWSPDGSKLAFALPEPELTSNIYVASSGGGDIRQITTLDRAADRSVSWSR